MAGKLKEKYSGIPTGRPEDHRRRAPAYAVWRHAEGCQAVQGNRQGVIEIAIRHDGEAYRTVVALQLGRNIYVRHAFQKKSKKGIATPKQDVDLIKQRYKEAKELAEDEQE